jgi:hypothetical protein
VVVVPEIVPEVLVAFVPEAVCVLAVVIAWVVVPFVLGVLIVVALVAFVLGS